MKTRLTVIIPITTIALMLLVSTGCEKNSGGGAQREEMDRTEAQQQIHLASSPPPVLDSSQERVNLIRRLETFNDPNNISYIYLLSRAGQVIANYTVAGKVSSVNSLLTTPDQVLNYGSTSTSYRSVVVASPDLDGSYGSNGDAIFFFTPEDVYVEWNGPYILQNQPFQLATAPLLTMSIDSQGRASDQ